MSYIYIHMYIYIYSTCRPNMFGLPIILGISSIISCGWRWDLHRTWPSHIQFVLAWPWTTRSSCTRCWMILMRPARWRAPPLRMPLLSWTMWQRTVTRIRLWSCSCCETIWPSGPRTRRPETNPFPGRDRLRSRCQQQDPIRSGTTALDGWRARGRWGEPDRATHKNAQKVLSAAALHPCRMRLIASLIFRSSRKTGKNHGILIAEWKRNN